MNHPLIPRWIILLLLAAAAVLPVAVCVVLALATLLGAMGDALGAQVLVYTSWAIGTLWCVGMVTLLLALAVRSLGESGNRREPPRETPYEGLEEPDA